MVCFGAVLCSDPSKTFYARTKAISKEYISEALSISGFTREEHENFPNPITAMIEFDLWLKEIVPKGDKPMFISDNNGKEIKDRYKAHLNVGDLKKFIEQNNLPDDAKVLVQRVEDFYYEQNNWGVYLKDSSEGVQQYHPVFSCVKYEDEDDILMLDLHY